MHNDPQAGCSQNHVNLLCYLVIMLLICSRGSMFSSLNAILYIIMLFVIFIIMFSDDHVIMLSCYPIILVLLSCYPV
jgi:hypothetical protein